LYAGFHIVSRAALNISTIVFIVYRNLISLVLLSPFAYFLEKCVSLFFFQQPCLLKMFSRIGMVSEF
jgi:hypothetical protein